MKKVFIYGLTILLCLCLALPAFAEGEETTIEEVTEEETEEVVENVTEDVTEGETTITAEDIVAIIEDEIEDESNRNLLYEVIDVATPEQLQAIKEAIIKAVNSVDAEEGTSWDKFATFIETNIDVITVVAFIVCSVIVIMVKVKKDNLLNASISTLNNNTVESTIKATDVASASVKVIEEYASAITDAIESLKKAEEENKELKEELAKQTKANAEASIVNAKSLELYTELMVELLNKSAITQASKDEFSKILDKAKSLTESIKDEEK